MAETALTPPGDDEPLEPTPEPEPEPSPAPGFNFRDHIPEDLREEACLADFKDLGSVFKSYVHAQKQIGQSLTPPGEDATPEDRAAFWQKLGAPADADGYVKAAQEAGLEIGEDFKRLAEKALASGISTSAMTELIGEYNAILTEAGEVNAKSADAAVQSLRGEWGAAFDKNMGLAQQVVKAFGGDGLIGALEASGAGNNTAVIKAFAAIGASLASEGLIDGSAVGAMTKQDALAKAEEIMLSPVYLSETGEAHKKAVAEVQRLMGLAYPEAQRQGEIVF